MRIATVNVNGIRASMSKSRGTQIGLGEWLAGRGCDVVALQEVRAPDDIVRDLLGGSGYHVAHTEAVQKGRQGVALLTRTEPVAVRIGFGTQGAAEFDVSGRWLEADLKIGRKLLTVVSVYVPSGDAEKPDKMAEKYRFLDAMVPRMNELALLGHEVVVMGDLNVGHTQLDIKNWKGNLKSAGFLPEERAYFDRFRDESGFIDVGRTHAGEVPGPYTWWSMRGQAFDTDTGWRIDYQWATPKLVKKATTVTVDKAPSWDQRWSDHAPLVVDYDF